MANSKRYSGLTRAQQQRRNSKVMRQWVAQGYNVNNNNWNTLEGRASARWRNQGYIGGTERIDKNMGKVLFGGRMGVSGTYANSGAALYPEQKQNAASRKKYREVRAALGLSAG